MPATFTKVTPNLVVADVERSIAFYREILGFNVGMSVPDTAPFVFAAVQSGDVVVFLNARSAAADEYPAFAQQPLGGTFTLYFDVTGLSALHDAIQHRVQVVRPIETRWYGATEFAFTDPDGYIITLSEHDTPA